jgi:uncharacterized membrane protein
MRRILALSALLGFAGCDDTLFQAEGGEAVTTEGFAGVQAIVDSKCLGCHSAAGAPGAYDLDLETDLHGAIVDVVGGYGVVLVEPGDPAASMFFQKITNTQADGNGSDMPIGSGGLPAEEAQIVEDWILDGAPPG